MHLADSHRVSPKYCKRCAVTSPQVLWAGCPHRYLKQCFPESRGKLKRRPWAQGAGDYLRNSRNTLHRLPGIRGLLFKGRGLRPSGRSPLLDITSQHTPFAPKDRRQKRRVRMGLGHGSGPTKDPEPVGPACCSTSWYHASSRFLLGSMLQFGLLWGAKAYQHPNIFWKISPLSPQQCGQIICFRDVTISQGVRKMFWLGMLLPRPSLAKNCFGKLR